MLNLTKFPSYTQVSFVSNDILIGFPSSSCMSSFNNNEPCPGFPTSNKFSSSYSFPWICIAYSPKVTGLAVSYGPFIQQGNFNLYESLHFADFAFIPGSLISWCRALLLLGNSVMFLGCLFRYVCSLYASFKAHGCLFLECSCDNPPLPLPFILVSPYLEHGTKLERQGEIKWR